MTVFLYIAAVSLFLLGGKPRHKQIARDSSYERVQQWIDTTKGDDDYWKMRERNRYQGRFILDDDLAPTHYFSPFRRHRNRS